MKGNGDGNAEEYRADTFMRGEMSYARPDEADDSDSDGSILNAKNQTFAVELVIGVYDPASKGAMPGDHHGVNYSVVESFPYMNREQTEVRFLCFGRKWIGSGWREAQYEAIVRGKRLGKLYVKLLAGVRAIIKPIPPVDDERKSQIDSVALEELSQLSVQEPLG